MKSDLCMYLNNIYTLPLNVGGREYRLYLSLKNPLIVVNNNKFGSKQGPTKKKFSTSYTVQTEQRGKLKIDGDLKQAILHNPKYDNTKPSVFDMFKEKESKFSLTYLKGMFT